MEQQQKSVWKMYSWRNRWKNNICSLGFSLGNSFSKLLLKTTGLTFFYSEDQERNGRGVTPFKAKNDVGLYKGNLNLYCNLSNTCCYVVNLLNFKWLAELDFLNGLEFFVKSCQTHWITLKS